MNTTDKNILIAEFMGMKPHNEGELDGFWTNTIKAHKYDSVANLQFNTSWDWLMEVVEKIRSIDSIAKEEFRTNLLHYQRNNKTIFDLSILEGKEYIYNACIAFIEWYNEQNKV